MTITYFAAYYNRHVSHLCHYLYEHLGDNFKFVVTEPYSIELINAGFHYENPENYPFVLKSYADSESYEAAKRLSESSDVVLSWGGAIPESFFARRMYNNQVTAYVNEHYFKDTFLRFFDPRTRIMIHKHHVRYSNKKLYMLCASSRTASDYALFGAYKGKAYKWGYFTEVQTLNIDEVLKKKPDSRIELLWCARFINWKHPEKVVKLAEILKGKKLNFHISMIGTGYMYDRIQKAILEKGLGKQIELLGSIPNEQAMEKMKNAHIFLATSDHGEGWGAVLGESMSRGCAVMADYRMGSAGYLIENGINGMIYKNMRQMVDVSESLIANEDKRIALAKNAYNTMHTIWNPQIAADRLICLFERLLQDDPAYDLFASGPCSKA